MRNVVLYKREGYYSPFPILRRLPDGRLAVALFSTPFADHFGFGEWIVLISDDEGESWRRTEDDPSVPYTWPGRNVRERYDRFWGIMPNDTYLAAGTIGYEIWDANRKEEAERQGLTVISHPSGDTDHIVVSCPTLFVQRSRDQGRTWQRQEWRVPGTSQLFAFPRWVCLADGTVLIPVYGGDKEEHARNYVLRLSDNGETIRLIVMTSDVSGLIGSETALLEVSPGRVLAMTRPDRLPGADGRLIESWSDDGGRTWSHPLVTPMWGNPADLIKLSDGRILCTYGYRRDPMGARACFSEDGGRSWDIENEVVIRDDGGTICSLWSPPRAEGGADVGYPMSVERSDGQILTVYYITLRDGITHSAATVWSP